MESVPKRRALSTNKIKEYPEGGGVLAQPTPARQLEDGHGQWW